MPNVREGGECKHSLHSFLFIENWYTRILANKLLLESVCKSLTKFGQTKERTVMDTVQHAGCQVMLQK